MDFRYDTDTPGERIQVRSTPCRADAGSSSRSGQGIYWRFGKRLLDLSLVLAFAPFAIPLITLLALTTFALDRRNPLFGHVRVGRDGRSFRCWKLRSMVPNAELKLKILLATDREARREWSANVKLAKDPRITPFGAFLRRTSLDELPQLWNVLRGDMSLVGARPVTAPELVRYGRYTQAYYAQRPGLTGLWQVSGRNDVSYEDRVAMDCDYLERISLKTDLGLILATVGEVLRRRGS